MSSDPALLVVGLSRKSGMYSLGVPTAIQLISSELHSISLTITIRFPTAQKPECYLT
jgi:hypothetical protein